LIRKVFENDLKKWKDTLLKPTHLYVKLAKELKTIKIHALAHITGGGIQNIPRVLPEGLGLELKSWEFPPEFKEVQKRTGMTDREILETLNCGIGMVVIADKAYANEIHRIADRLKFKSYDLGKVVESPEQILYPKDFSSKRAFLK
jgi:phosphoribosylaminoimidazole (AIR) synthetase